MWRPRPHQPKKPAGLSRRASYAVTLAGFRDRRQDIEQLLRKCGARQQQEDQPGRPDAIRRIVELGVDGEAQG